MALIENRHESGEWMNEACSSQVHTGNSVGEVLLLGNVMERMTCKRLLKSDSINVCVRVHPFASVRNAKSLTKLLA